MTTEIGRLKAMKTGERTQKLTLDLADAVDRYLAEIDNPVPDYLHRRQLRDHMKKTVAALRQATGTETTHA